MKKECTKEIALKKAENYCASAERCITEVEAKLYQWNTDEKTIQKVIYHLIENKFIDEQRYAIAFVQDKFRFNGWGRIKIVIALRQKNIPEAFIHGAINEINEQEYTKMLYTLLEQKRKTIKGNSEYERNGKLIKHALSKGFELEEIMRIVKQSENENDLD